MSESSNPTPAQPGGPESGRNGGGRLTKVIVEVANRKNRQLLWGPTQARLRGAWTWNNMARGESSEAGLTRMPDIPGLYIVVDPQARTLAIQDPLAEPHNAKLLAEISDVHEAVYGTRVRPVPEYVKDEASPDEIATWLYWLYRNKAAGNVREVFGTVPGLPELARAMPKAKIRRHFHDSTTYRRDRAAGTALAKVSEEES